MTHAAMYESSAQYRRDFFIKRYFKDDYIALNRFLTKAWMTLFFCIFLAAYAFILVYVEGVDLLHFDYQQFMIRAILVYLGLNILVSLLSSAVYGSRYAKAEKRMKEYFSRLDQIDAFEE